MISFASEGVSWAGNLVTWSFADTTLAPDAGAPFTAGLDDAQQAIVRQAVAQWAAVAGLQIVELPPGSAAVADIRIGFGDLTGNGNGILAGSNSGGEVGDTTWRYASGQLQPDVVIRLQDPAVQALLPAADGALTYAGTQTSLFQVALHEVGHALGLAHSADPSAVMNEDVGPANDALGASDIAGVQWLYPQAASTALSAGGSGGGTVLALPGGASIAFASIAMRAAAATLLGPALDGQAAITWVELAAGDALAAPALPAGQSGVLTTAASGAVALGSGYTGLVDTAGSGSLRVSAGDRAGQSIVAGGGGNIAVTSGAGGGTLIAGDGDDSFVANPNGGNWAVLLGGGGDTVSTAGRDTVATSYGAPSAGHAQVFMGTGSTVLVSGGQDTVIGGGGTDTVFGVAGGVLAYGGSGTLTLVAAGAAVTLVGGTGTAVVYGSADHGATVFAGSGDTEFVGGAASSGIIGGAGALTVYAGTGGDLVRAGTGAARIYAGQGAQVTAGAGMSTITGADGAMIRLAGSGSGVVVLGDGAETIDASAASASNVLFAGSGRDLILAGAASDTVFAGTGSATLAGGGRTDFDFVNHVATGTTQITGWHAGDHLVLTGYGSDAAEQVLASASAGGSGLTLALSGGGSVLIAGVHTLAAASLLG